MISGSFDDLWIIIVDGNIQRVAEISCNWRNYLNDILQLNSGPEEFN